jgi:hypothetical protein
MAKPKIVLSDVVFVCFSELVKRVIIQSQRGYLPSLELSTNQAKQQTSTLHIGTHILSGSSKADCWVSVLRLLFGWMAMVCCQVLLFAW